MNIRIQPRDIEVLAGDPFEHDLLGRKESIEALTNVISSLDGPCVMAVDAGWGMGKTTFLKMWAQHLRNERFPVVEFNAWETDFAQDPFVALYSEITGGLSGLPGASGRIDELRAAAGVVFRALPAAAARVAVAAVPYAGSQLVDELSPRPPTAREAVAESYQEAKTALRDFREQLGQIATAIAQENDNAPLVVMIDELDRCRPTYAIELLEAAKHLFSVDHIVFVVCLDRAQLAHSVKAVYGASFDADGYLRRFFDIDYRLQSSDRAAFVSTKLDSMGVTEFLGRTGGISRHFQQDSTQSLISKYLALSDISLRDILQAIHRLGLVLASLPEEELGCARTLAILLLLRAADANAYESLWNGNATDEIATRDLFVRGELHQLRDTTDGVLLEATIIAALIVAQANQHDRMNYANFPLLRRYEAEIDTDEAAGEQASPSAMRAHWIVDAVDRLCRWSPWHAQPDRTRVLDHLAYEAAMRRLELFPDDSDSSRQA